MFAKEIGFNKQVLDNYVTYADYFYNTFYINKKKKSKKRQIDSPSTELKSIQRWLLANYLCDLPVSNAANGFIKGRGIKRNAQFHLNQPYLLKIDIQNFFPSISQAQVFKSLRLHFDDKNLTLKISKLCSYRRKLPQGAPTSPMLSNIVFKEIDDKITHHCNSRLIVYTRYADDLTFSSNNKTSLVEVYQFVENLLYKNSFRINKTKTQYLSGKGRMSITGININEGRLTIGRGIKRTLRSSLFKIIIEDDHSINHNVVFGYLSFLKDIEPEYYKRIQKYIDKLKLERKLKRMGLGRRVRKR